MTTYDEDCRNLYAARTYLARLLPTSTPLSDAEVHSLTLRAGLWSLHEETRPPERRLREHLQGHARLLRGTNSELDRLDAEHLRYPAGETGARGAIHPNARPQIVEESAPKLVHKAGAAKMHALAERLQLPWLTRLPLPAGRMQVSYRVTRAFEQTLEDAWREKRPNGGTRNALHTTLLLAYLAVPEIAARVRYVQDVRYSRYIKDRNHLPSQEARQIGAFLRHNGISQKGAPTLRDQVTQLSYRTTVQANNALQRTLRREERTMAYLHLDLLALYLVAPDVRAFIDHVVEERAVQ